MACRITTIRQAEALTRGFSVSGSLMERRHQDGDGAHDRYQQDERDHHQAAPRITRAAVARIHNLIVHGTLYAILTILRYQFPSNRPMLREAACAFSTLYEEVRTEACATYD